MKNVLKYLLLALIAVSQLFACGGSDDEKTPADNFDVQFTVPGSVDVTEGGECTFAVSGGKANTTMPITSSAMPVSNSSHQYLTACFEFSIKAANEFSII